MNNLFFANRRKVYFKIPDKRINSSNKYIISRTNFARPKHSFRQGLLTRLANPAGCGCGK